MRDALKNPTLCDFDRLCRLARRRAIFLNRSHEIDALYNLTCIKDIRDPSVSGAK